MCRGVLPTTVDSQGVMFIDRDPKHFQLLLNFLRDGWCRLPPTAEERQELLHEVRFMQLANMEAWVRAQEEAPLSSHSSPGPGRPTVAYTGSPGRRVLYTLPPPAASPSVARAPAPGLSPQRFTASAAAPSAHAPAASSAAIRAAFLEAAAAGPSPGGGPAYALPPASVPSADAAPHATGGGAAAPGAAATPKWTSKYLAGNCDLRDAANVLMELAYVAPHRALHAGKVTLRVSPGVCRHERPASLLGGEPSGEAARGRPELVTVHSTSGWSFELTLKPGTTEPEMFDRYHVQEFVQDNWFVLGAVLKDQFGVVMEEDTSARPTCPACRRCTLAVTLTKVF